MNLLGLEFYNQAENSLVVQLANWSRSYELWSYTQTKYFIYYTLLDIVLLQIFQIWLSVFQRKIFNIKKETLTRISNRDDKKKKLSHAIFPSQRMNNLCLTNNLDFMKTIVIKILWNSYQHGSCRFFVVWF